VGLFSPEEKSAEIFGFRGFLNKLAGVFGIIVPGLFQTQFGLQKSVLFCAALFLVAIAAILFVNRKRREGAADLFEEKNR